MMRKLRRETVVVFIVCVMCAMTPASAPADKMESDEVDAIMATIRMHDTALSTQDMPALLATYLPENPNIALMGTGPGETWVGREDIKIAYGHFFEDFDKGSLTSKCPWHSIGAHGKIAWVMAACTFTDSSKGEQRQYGVNITAVLEKVEATWYFLNFHFSNLTGVEQ